MGGWLWEFSNAQCFIKMKNADLLIGVRNSKWFRVDQTLWDNKVKLYWNKDLELDYHYHFNNPYTNDKNILYTLLNGHGGGII